MPFPGRNQDLNYKADKSGSGKKEDDASPVMLNSTVKFEFYGEEIIEKKVKKSGNSGRIYLPPEWVGHYVKIIRIN